MAAIALEEVSKSYELEDGSELTVFEDVSLEIRDREFFTFVGPSGCGKSTLLDIIAGLTTPNAGSVSIGDGDSGDGDGGGEDSRFGFVFQAPTLLDWKTVRENLAFALRNMGVPKEEHEDRIEETLSMVGLLEFADQYPQSLSGGMQQRVGLARAFCVDPDILLMDEPFGSLDEITARQLRDDLLEMWRDQDKTVVFVTHDIDEAVYLSDRIGVLSDKPTRVHALREIDVARPRDHADPDLLAYEDSILSDLGIE